MYVYTYVCVFMSTCVCMYVCMWLLPVFLIKHKVYVCMYVMWCNRGADIGGAAEAFPREEDFEERIAIAL